MYATDIESEPRPLAEYGRVSEPFKNWLQKRLKFLEDNRRSCKVFQRLLTSKINITLLRLPFEPYRCSEEDDCLVFELRPILGEGSVGVFFSSAGY